MRTVTKLKGLPLYTQSGQFIGFIQDFLFSNDGSIYGFITEEKGLFRRDKLIPISTLKAVQDDQVTIQEAKLDTLEKPSHGHRFFEKKAPIRHKQVLNENGDCLGLVYDVYMSQNLDTIVAYEVTEGFFADVTVGTKTLPVQQDQSIGKDAIVLH